MLSKQNQGILNAIEKGYKVIGNQAFNGKGKAIKINYNDGYPFFNVSFFCADNGNKINAQIPIHRFIAYLKYGNKIFDCKIQVRHLDGVRANFAHDNIDIGTQRQNIQDRPKDQRLAHATKTSSYRRKFTDEQVKQIKQDHDNGLSYKKIMIKWNIKSKGTISYLINNEYVTTRGN
jgi:hypothetical protein